MLVSASGQLTITSTPSEGGRVVLACAGELDVASARQLEQQVNEVLGRGAREIALDLTDLRFIDSSGVHCLTLCDRAATEAGGRLLLCKVPAAVRQVLTTVGVASRLHWEE